MTSLWRHLWPNYNTLDFKILTQCVKLLGERVLQVWWWYLHWFRRYRKKTRGGARNSPPPSGARVNWHVNMIFDMLIFWHVLCYISAIFEDINLKFCTHIHETLPSNICYSFWKFWFGGNCLKKKKIVIFWYFLEFSKFWKSEIAVL